MYDIFYVSRTLGNDTDWDRIKSKYPLAQKLTNISSYDQIKSKAFTKMFWVIWDDINLSDNFNLIEYKATKWDDMYVHVFKNGEHYDGVCLFPKSLDISKREFYHRFFTNKKEIDIEASTPKQYKIHSPLTYDEYLKIDDEIFWLKWPEIEILDQGVFNLYFSHHNSYDRRENHIFKNLCNNNESFIGGLILCSKYKQLSEKEFKNRYAVDKKEYNVIASRYRYPVYNLTTYTEYVELLNNQHQDLFWGIWPEIEIADKSIFDFYFDPRSGEYDHDRNENHVFKHLFNDKEVFVNGLVLFSKNKQISQREFDHRFLITKKEHDRLVSKHKIYDVVFISYNEPNADENYNNLLLKCPRAKRVHGVKGIHQAHIAAAKLCDTEMIWIVDGDAVIEDNFDFNLVMSSYDVDCVHVWRSKNPINNLEYGYGGVKLLPRKLTLNMDVNSPDMTTSISKKFKAMDSVSNVTSFNTDPFTTWRSAFRECAKLSSRAIQRHLEEETKARLDVWCTVAQGNYSKEAILGARAGRLFGEENKNNFELLSKINDFDWLKEKFENEQRAKNTNT